jgi:hypothetical protein
MKKKKMTPGEFRYVSGPGVILNWPEQCANEPIPPDFRDRFTEIEDEVLSIDPSLDRNDEEFRRAVVVIAGGILVGPFVDRLVSLTDYPRSLVADVCSNMRASGLWRPFATDAEWMDDEGYYPFVLWTHVLVSMGLVSTMWDKDLECWLYRSKSVN